MLDHTRKEGEVHEGDLLVVVEVVVEVMLMLGDGVCGNLYLILII
jgi:hypothetical protein